MATARIVDVRCRLPGASDGAYLAERARSRNAASQGELDERGFFRLLDAAGIRTAVSVAYNNQGLRLGSIELPPRRTNNDLQAELQRRHPGRFVGVAGIDVGGELHEPLAELERVRALGLRVVGIEPGRAPFFAEHPADPSLRDFYTRAQELGLVIALQTSGVYGGRSIDYAHPRWIDRLAFEFPDLRIICGHGCYPYVDELIVVARRHHNVYPSPDLYIFAPNGRSWVHAVNTGAIADTFLFATGFPLGGPPRRAVCRFLLLGWRPSRLDAILFGNALRVLGLDHDPAFAPPGAARGRRYGIATVVGALIGLLLHESNRWLRRGSR